MKRKLSLLLAVIMLVGILPFQVFAEGEVKYPVTIKFMEVRVASDAKEEEYTEHEVVFENKDEMLGIQLTVPRTHEGQIRGRGFMGWTNVRKSEFSESNSNRLYSANNTVEDVLNNEKADEDGKITLYAYYDGVVAQNVEFMGQYIPVPNDNVDKHKYVFIHDELKDSNVKEDLFVGDIEVKSVEEEERSNIQKNSWGEDLSHFTEGDRGSVLRDKTITSYYHPTIKETKINFQSSFNMHKGIALLVRNNGSWGLSGSEVKLEVRIPDGIELEDTLSGVEFESRTFRIKGVEATDKDNNEVSAAIENNNLYVENNTFNISFEDGKGKDVRNLKLIVEPKKRGLWDAQNPAENQEAINKGMDDLKATEVVKEMHWNGKSAAHFSKAKSKELAENQSFMELDGSVYGQILFSLNGLDYPLGMRELKSNKLIFKFVYPEVTFIKNTKSIGDDAEQELAKIKAKEEDAETLFIGEDNFAKDPTFTKDGKEVKFLGWNTQADGKGKMFTPETDVTKDITVYAIWEAPETPPTPEPQPEPQPEPKLEPKPEPSPEFKFKEHDKTPTYPVYAQVPKTEEKAKEVGKEVHKAYIFGYEDKSVRANGNLTRAEAASMITRLAGLELSDTSKADYKDLKEKAWYLAPINAALKAGMLDADGENLRPDDKITRAEFAKMLAAIDKENDHQSNFPDIRGHKYEREINKIDGNKRIEGYEDGTFRPDSFLTRAEAASFLNRMFNRIADEEAVAGLEGSLVDFTDLKKSDWFYFEITEAANSHYLNRRGGADKYQREFEKWTSLINLDEVKK